MLQKRKIFDLFASFVTNFSRMGCAYSVWLTERIRQFGGLGVDKLNLLIFSECGSGVGHDERQLPAGFQRFRRGRRPRPHPKSKHAGRQHPQKVNKNKKK